MTWHRLLFWMLFAAMMAVYLTMALWTLPTISRDAGGLIPFDLRPMGYSPEEARAFLAALGEQGRALYLGPQKWLDLAYPGQLGLVLGYALWHMAPARPAGLRLALVTLPVIASTFDYLENIRVAGMLLAVPGSLTDRMIEAANFATVMKSGFASAAFVALLVAFVWRLWRKRG
jgi:hypothetical protein